MVTLIAQLNGSLWFKAEELPKFGKLHALNLFFTKSTQVSFKDNNKYYPNKDQFFSSETIRKAFKDES